MSFFVEWDSKPPKGYTSVSKKTKKKQAKRKSARAKASRGNKRIARRILRKLI